MKTVVEAGQPAQDAALAEILVQLAGRGYAFISPTPGTHRRVSHRPYGKGEVTLRDVFGWSRPFTENSLDPTLLDLMRTAGMVEPAADGIGLQATLRVSTVDDLLYWHSAPTADPDAVFLGPDSYRYTRFLRQRLENGPAITVALDIGTGAGVGALTLAAHAPDARVIGSDINHKALRLTQLNASHNRLPVSLIQCSGLPCEPTRFDLICANPPYVAGDMKRTYRDGGGVLGAGLALAWVGEGLPRLKAGGRFLLYTGSAIVDGQDLLRAKLENLASVHGCDLSYEEIDPDIFGGTLSQPAYAEVERIAAVGAALTAR